MLKAEENERLVRVGRGKPAGELFRRYWMPALLSSEVAEVDGPPVRVRLLGENLIAFRDSSGRVGLVDAFWPAPTGPAVLWPQRGMRHPLRLSRLEVRRRRQLPRYALGAGRY